MSSEASDTSTGWLSGELSGFLSRARTLACIEMCRRQQRKGTEQQYIDQNIQPTSNNLQRRLKDVGNEESDNSNLDGRPHFLELDEEAD
jgi:hypothetical protein